MTKTDGDLGYTFRRLKSGNVAISQHGCLATTLRGANAVSFLLEMPRIPPASQQREMARLAGKKQPEQNHAAPDAQDEAAGGKPD